MGTPLAEKIDNLGPFWTHLHNGPIQTKINLLPHMDKVGFGGCAFEQKIIFRLKWSKRVSNGKKHLGYQFQTFLDPFKLLWNVEKPAMFGHFCLFYWCVFLGHPVYS